MQYEGETPRKIDNFSHYSYLLEDLLAIFLGRLTENQVNTKSALQVMLLAAQLVCLVDKA